MAFRPLTVLSFIKGAVFLRATLLLFSLQMFAIFTSRRGQTLLGVLTTAQDFVAIDLVKLLKDGLSTVGVSAEGPQFLPELLFN